MTNVEKLKEIQSMKFKIEKLEELAKYYEQMSYSLGGQSFDREVIDCTRNLDAPFVKWIYKKIDVENQIKDIKKKLDEKSYEMSKMLEFLENIDYRTLLMYRYLSSYEWCDIASSMHLSLSTVYRYHRYALSEFDKIKPE